MSLQLEAQLKQPELYSLLFNYALSLSKNVDTAYDLVQETIMMALQCARKGGFVQGTSVYLWLKAILRNCRIEHYRKYAQRGVKSVPLDDSIEYPIEANQFHRLALAELLKDFMKLPPAQFEVMFQKVWHGKTEQEIANTLQKPIGTIKSRRRLAYDRLMHHCPE